MKQLIFVWLLLCLGTAAYAQSYSFAVKTYGTGKQTLVFIPGFACSGEVWQETVNALQDRYTCYVLTMPGFAGVPPETSPSFEGWKKQIIHFIRDRQLRKPYLVGHSMGGGLALAVAADCPNLLQGVVVVDALPCLAALYRPDFQPSLEEQTQACNSLLQQLNAMSDEQFIRQQRLSAATLCEDSTRQEALVRWSTASDKRTFAQLYADYANTDLRLRLSAIHVPVLVLLEPSFHRVEPLVREQFAGLPDVRLEYAPQGLHFLMFDARDWFLQQFTAFIHP